MLKGIKMPRLKRIVLKNGDVNILNETPGPGWIDLRQVNFLEIKWYTFVVFFCTINLMLFLIFAGLYTIFTQEPDRGT
jgi:hypothetical protein